MGSTTRSTPEGVVEGIFADLSAVEMKAAIGQAVQSLRKEIETKSAQLKVVMDTPEAPEEDEPEDVVVPGTRLVKKAARKRRIFSEKEDRISSLEHDLCSARSVVARNLFLMEHLAQNVTYRLSLRDLETLGVVPSDY